MIRFPALLGLPMMLTLAACAQAGQSGGPGTSPDHRREAFQQRATEIAERWQATPRRQEWQTGYVPLQDPTVLPAEPKFNDETKQAFLAGWYREQVSLPASKPPDGTVRFPDGTLTVPLIGAAEAYRQIDQGDPPPCPSRPAPPPASPSGPDGSVSSDPATACHPLTVTAVKLGTVPVRTSRGEAQVPAWLFTVEELATPVARLAVAPSAVGPVPEASALAPSPSTELVAAQDLIAVDGAKLTYRLGVGACDQDIVPLVQQRDDVVVVSGGVTRATGVCTEQLIVKPVTVTLDAPLGARPVLDATTGQALLLKTG
jgi:phage baseplate assembly protein gpV